MLPRNASRGVTAMTVFKILSNKYVEGSSISLGLLQDEVKKSLSEVMKDGRSRSVKRAIENLNGYGILAPTGRNRFGEPTYELDLTIDRGPQVFLKFLCFIGSVTNDWMGLQRMEAIMGTTITGFRKVLFPDISENVDLLLGPIYELAKAKKMSIYTATAFFRAEPVIYRIYSIFHYIYSLKREYNKDNDPTLSVFKLFNITCNKIAKGWLEERNNGDYGFIQIHLILADMQGNSLPEKVRLDLKKYPQVLVPISAFSK